MNTEGKSWRELTDEVDLLEGLILSPAWKILLNYLFQDRENVLASITDTPLHSAEEIYSQEFLKGRCFQAKIVSQFPKVLVDDLRIHIDSLKQSEEENDERTSDSDPE